MIWNYTNNRPFGECRELTISPKLFKAEVEKWVSEQKEQELISAAGEQSLNAALKSVGYDLHQFMWNHAYNMISDAKLREYFVVYMCLSYSSSQKIIPYNTVENRLMGDVDILTKSHDMRWGDTTTVSDMDIYCRLYFCETEKDVFSRDLSITSSDSTRLGITTNIRSASSSTPVITSFCGCGLLSPSRT